MTITLTLHQQKTTKNAVLYGVASGNGLHPFSNIYVRKDALRREGHRDFPTSIKVTVEIPE